VRTRLPVLGAGLMVSVAALGGCAAEIGGPPPVLPPVTVPQLPAAVAGGACELLDYPTIEQQLGVRFDVAAASRVGDTYTCVVQAQGATRPDLVLAVSEKTPADASVFTDDLTPEGAKTVKGLGKAAYRVTLAARKGGGAAVEVGWLTGDKRLITLRYTLAEGKGEPEADKLASRVVALAKTLDLSSL
jgi:hypothetical protein